MGRGQPPLGGLVNDQTSLRAKVFANATDKPTKPCLLPFAITTLTQGHKRMRYASNYCTYREVYEPQHGYIFTGPCFVTKKEYSVFVPAAELFAYNQGAHIQDAMPSVSKEDREFLMSGMSPEGWNIAFPPDEEEEEYDYGDDDLGRMEGLKGPPAD
jgi:hypothetical protein